MSDTLSGQLELELSREASAPGQARRALTNLLTGTLSREELDTAKLLSTELVTNAVLHGHGMILFRAKVSDRVVRVDVIDEGGGFHRVVRERTFDSFGGWGLALVEAEASRWGILEGATHVWFELERSSAHMQCA